MSVKWTPSKEEIEEEEEISFDLIHSTGKWAAAGCSIRRRHLKKRRMRGWGMQLVLYVL